MDKRELVFRIGFLKTAGIGSKLLNYARPAGEWLMSKAIRPAWEHSSEAALNYAKKRGATLAAGSVGWAAGENIFKNLREGTPINPYEIADQSVRNLATFTAFDLGTKGLGAAWRGAGNLMGRGAAASKNYLASKAVGASKAIGSKLPSLQGAASAAERAASQYTEGGSKVRQLSKEFATTWKARRPETWQKFKEALKGQMKEIPAGADAATSAAIRAENLALKKDYINKLRSNVRSARAWRAGSKDRAFGRARREIQAVMKPIPQNASPEAVKAIRESNRAMRQKYYSNIRKAKDTLWGVGGGAALGAATGYDSDNPITSTVFGAGKGALTGGLLYTAPGIGKNKSSIRELTSGIRGGLGIAAFENAMEKKTKRDQQRALREYYKQMGYNTNEQNQE